MTYTRKPDANPHASALGSIKSAKKAASSALNGRNVHRALVTELLAIFGGREEIPDIGQFTPADKRRLLWGLRHRLIERRQKPWPGPIVGTCTKTWYVRQP